MLTRRHAIRLGLTTGAVGAVGAAGGLFQTLTSGGSANAATAAGAPAVTPFAVPLPVPKVLAPYRRTSTADYYAVTMSRTSHQILPGTRTDVLTYNGTFPGPTIRARKGRTAVVRQINALDMPASVHLHGGSNPVEHDGGMMDTIAPGRSRTYVYANEQVGATLWTHDHAHHMESEHVYRGLSGLYLLGDKAEDALGLPSGRYEVPLILRDAQFDAAGRMVYTMDDAENRTTILVNGAPWPYMKVEARKYRFRMLNSCNLRIFILCLNDGSQVTQIGSDGGLLPAPAATPVLVLSPGERADFVVDFSKYAPGTQLTLQNMLGPGPTELVGQIMRFDVGEKSPDTSRVPDVLTALPALPKPAVERSFDLRMDEPGTGDKAYINGKTFDAGRIDTNIKWGDTEVWTVTNTSTTIPHNFHTHLVQFRILERDGQPVYPAEAGLKDTVLLFPGQTARLQLTFDTHKGVYPYHCHMIDHSAMGMMAQMKIS
ncbi:multicopper oxidase domain-containing protein [Streptomyces sp. NBC_01474]|uniref:multicopper oxidase family protein n=1 Tax=unclassified Streptomyces TaxID=2593676 RepID=UPI002DD90033|nr:MULTISPECIES: multicopper oxidase domain-containing protein [unclassified Streptomyces]WSD95534.1 multicopper oxidase domain-containing protein [Streptomyces sp. NBC_01474]